MASRPSLVGIAMAMLGCLSSAACASVLEEDFDSYVARPSTCDLVEPHTTSPRDHVVCSAAETCVPAAADGAFSRTERRCIIARSIEPRAACIYSNDCGAGMFCAGLSGCIPYCRLRDSTCANGAPCLTFHDGPVQNGRDELGYCAAPSCNPLGTDCDGACRFDRQDRASCFPDHGTGRRGDACKIDEECKAGLACGPPGSCTPYSRMDADADDCNGGHCRPIDGEELAIDGTRFGYCDSP